MPSIFSDGQIASCLVSVSEDRLKCLFAVSLETVVVTIDNHQVNGLGFREKYCHMV